MTYFEAVILGLVQGLAEFLPISSSGHLALLQQWFNINEDKVLLFAVLLHVGTLISVFIVYWRDIWELIVELCLTVKDLCTGKGLRLEERPVRKLGIMIIVATIPTAIIGLLFNDIFDRLYTSILPIGIGLIITGFLLVFDLDFVVFLVTGFFSIFSSVGSYPAHESHNIFLSPTTISVPLQSLQNSSVLSPAYLHLIISFSSLLFLIVLPHLFSVDR